MGIGGGVGRKGRGLARLFRGVALAPEAPEAPDVSMCVD